MDRYDRLRREIKLAFDCMDRSVSRSLIPPHIVDAAKSHVLASIVLRETEKEQSNPSPSPSR
jgi:hypothetical protein